MSHKSLLPAPSHYTTLPANADLVYDSICKVLSERGEQACTEHGSSVDWGEFSAAEWALLPRMAKAEGVAPLMHWKLKGMDCEVPSVVLS